MNHLVAPVLQAVSNPSNLKAQYWDEEAEQLLRDGLKVDNLVLHVELGCAGYWYASFVHEGRQYVAIGDCDACPSCASSIEEYRGFTKPAETLEQWLTGADVRMAASIQEAHACILADPSSRRAFELRRLLESDRFTA